MRQSLKHIETFVFKYNGSNATILAQREMVALADVFFVTLSTSDGKVPTPVPNQHWWQMSLINSSLLLGDDGVGGAVRWRLSMISNTSLETNFETEI